ncbi:hypothetical protein L2E82_25407 [Cichorium intybus]|uniref:Uncharacterized protein n=1 Tax=Cichorium intybus TaxID=13427 RepID=A0ACB9E4I3_CICIN|nr:hypothetical protein L2E82_25407 [Cichorium intybus]
MARPQKICCGKFSDQRDGRQHQIPLSSIFLKATLSLGLPTEAALKTSKLDTRFMTRCCEWWTKISKRLGTLELDRMRKSMTIIVREQTSQNWFLVQDPPRDQAHFMIEDCRGAGIKVLVITGDHKLTVLAICKEIWLFHEGEILVNQVAKEAFDRALRLLKRLLIGFWLMITLVPLRLLLARLMISSNVWEVNYCSWFNHATIDIMSKPPRKFTYALFDSWVLFTT